MFILILNFSKPLVFCQALFAISATSLIIFPLFLHLSQVLELRRLSQSHTAQKMKFSIRDFLSKCDQIRSFLRIWSHLLKKSLMENFIFCAMSESSSSILFPLVLALEGLFSDILLLRSSNLNISI